MKDFPPLLTRETAIVTSGLLSCALVAAEKRFTLKGKNLMGTNLLLLE